MQQYIDTGDQHKHYERKVQKKTSLFYKQAQEEKEEFQKFYEKDVNALAIFEAHPELKEFINHFEERNSRFYHRLDRILSLETSIKEFANGFAKYGLFRTNDLLIYRDWGPEADSVSIAGTFNQWDLTQFTCSQNGQEWEVAIDQFPRAFKYLVCERKNGVSQKKISCWSRHILLEDNQYVAAYDEESYEFTHEKPNIAEMRAISVDYKENEMIEKVDKIIARGFNTIILRGAISHKNGQIISYLAPSGAPNSLKMLIDYIHSKGAATFIDFPLELSPESPLVSWDGSPYHYFSAGTHQIHYDFEKWELSRYLLSSLSYWLQEFKLDGFNFPNLTRVILNQEKLQQDLKTLLTDNCNIDGLLFLMFANNLIHRINENAKTIGSQAPALYPAYTTIKAGGLGFDYYNIAIEQF